MSELWTGDAVIILCDTREQKPLDFSPWSRKVEVVKLKYGDYSIKGMEGEVSVERKSVHDLVNTLIHARERFARELDILKSYRDRMIIVEGTLRDIYMHRYRSKVHPNAVIGLVNHIFVTTGIPTLFSDDPEMTAWYVQSYFHGICQREERIAEANDNPKQ